MTQAAREALIDFLERIDDDSPRLVVRWADETRIMPEEEQERGFTVKPIAYAILTAKIDGEPVQERIEDITLDVIKKLVRDYPVQVLYRSDNLTR